jgi:uncharacterized protein with NRDE domain
MCTVILRFSPGSPTPLLVGAVRDEFADRAWDPPARHWGDRLIGGRDRVAGGTWLAVDPARPAVAALLNGVRLPEPADGDRPSRGDLPLDALRGKPLPTPDRYNGYHLLAADPTAVEVWTWDGASVTHHALPPGDHVIVNAGIDVDTPLVRRLRTGLDRDWHDLLGGGGIDPAGPDALIVRREYQERVYASTSATLLGFTGGRVRYEFTANPGPGASWYEVPV